MGNAWFSVRSQLDSGATGCIFVVIAGMATAAISSYAAVLKSYVVFLTPLLSLLDCTVDY